MTLSKPNILSPRRADAILIWSLRCLAVVAGGIVLLILWFLLVESLPALQQIGWWRFILDDSWHPLSDQYNMAPMIAGSLLVTIGAVLLAAPLGFGSALFCRYYAPRRIATVYRRVIELLAGIPSVVYGLWGLVVLVPMLSHSLLVGILILALMILPTIALIADSVLGNVPVAYLRGAAALGLTRWGMIWRVILPTARSGLITAVLLATARAIGETMAVLMVCGNVVQLPRSLMEPIRTLTANIALEMAYATEDHRAVLFVSGLLLMGIVGVLIGIAEWISRGRIYG